MDVNSSVERYSILASAVASRQLCVELTETEPTYTDGDTVFVNAATAASDVADAVVVQAALLAGGALQEEVMTRLRRSRGRVRHRYLALEICRLAEKLEDTLPSHTVSRIRGACDHPVSSSNSESLERALSREPIPPAPEWAGTVRPSRLRRISQPDVRAPASDDDLMRLGQLAEQPAESEEPEDDADESKIIKLLSAPGMSNPLGEALQKLLGMGRSGSDRDGGSADIGATRQRFSPVGRNAKRGRVGQLLSAMLQPVPVAGIRYPEWDGYKGVYRPDWCTVAEFDPPRSEAAAEPKGRQAPLERPLARVGIERERHRRQIEGDSLDLSALLEYEIDIARGVHPDPSIYENHQRTKRDLSVLVLLDCSGSTAEEAGGHVVFEEERQLAADVTAGLERLGDRVATYGFYSQGKDAVKFLRIKEFNDRFDVAAKRRLWSVQPSGFTRIGAAIRHAGHILESQALARNMVLLVIGDGLPYDDGYEDRYARADARHAIREAMQRGIGVAGIGIRSSTPPEVLEEVWSDTAFRVIGQSDDAQRHIRGLLVNALAMTRTNGRRRDMFTEEHHLYLRAVHASRRGKLNSYV